MVRLAQIRLQLTTETLLFPLWVFLPTVHVQVTKARANSSLHQGQSSNLRVMAGGGVICTLCQAVIAHIWLQAE